MAKMNLDFILSPADGGNNGAGRGERSDGRSSRSESSPLSLDYIAPRNSPDDRARPRPPQHRRFPEHVTQPRFQPGSSSARPPPSSKDQSSRSNFKSKKGKGPGSPPSLRSPASVDVKPHVCKSCDRSFYKLEQLKRHDRLVHQNLRPFVCPTCDLSFGTKQNMQVHLTTRKHQLRLKNIQESNRGSQHGSSSRQHPPPHPPHPQ